MVDWAANDRFGPLSDSTYVCFSAARKVATESKTPGVTAFGATEGYDRAHVADCSSFRPARRVEVALIRVHVTNLRRSDDLVRGVTLGDDVALGDVASTDPFPGQRIAMAEREKLQAHFAIIARSPISERAERARSDSFQPGQVNARPQYARALGVDLVRSFALDQKQLATRVARAAQNDLMDR